MGNVHAMVIKVSQKAFLVMMTKTLIRTKFTL